MNKKSKYFLSLGFVGITIIWSLNIFSLYVLDKENAIFFSEEWNSIWLVNYIVWFVILMIGFAFRFSNKK